MKKKIIIIGASLIILVAVGILIFSISENKKYEENDKKVIKIGAILPLTGDYALAGQNTKLGIDLAIKSLNEKNNKNSFVYEVIYEDTKGEPKIGINAVNKLINIDKVEYIIDNSISSITLATTPIVEKNKVVMLSTGATSPDITEAGDYLFRIWNSDELEINAMFKKIEENVNIKNITILFANNDYGKGFQKVIEKKHTNHHFTINFESFELGQRDFKNQIIKIKNNSSDAIYLIGYSNECIQIIKKLKELNYKGIILGTTVMLDPSVFDVIKEIKYTFYYPYPINNSILGHTEFVNKYKKLYNEEPPVLSDVGYDAIMLLNLAITKGSKYDGEIIKNFFLQMNEYDGASGKIKFDKNGDVNKPIDLLINKY
jgi:branched-chain amino acid transport system substrate-binding protein